MKSENIRKNKIIFVEPYWGHNAVNTPGIANLRGFLRSKGIKSDVINFNKILDNRKKVSNTDYKKLLSNYIEKKINSSDIAKKESCVMSDLFNLGPVAVIDAVNKIDFFEEIFKKHCSKLLNFEYIGISVSFSWQLVFSLILSKYIKENTKEKIKIILGGSFITLHHKDLVVLFKNNPTIDYLIIGEGETPLWKLIKKNKLNEVPNLIYLKGGSYKCAKNLNHFEDITMLPVPIFETGDALYIRATRRCYWGKCAYCTLDKNKITGNILTKSPEQVMEDIKRLGVLAGDQKIFVFVDNALPIPFLRKFCQKIIKEKRNRHSNYSFIAYLRPEKSLDYETLRLAKEAGFIKLKFGIETFIPRLSRLLNRGIDTKNTLEIIKICFKLKLSIDLYSMVGLPTQTEQELKIDLNSVLFLAKKYHLIIKKFQVLPFRLEEGSIMYYNPSQYNIKPLYDQKKYLSRTVPFKQLKRGAISSEEAWLMYENFYSKNKDIFINFDGFKPFFWKDLERNI